MFDKKSFLAIIQKESEEINKKEEEERNIKEKFDRNLAYLIGVMKIDYDKAFQALQFVNGNLEEAKAILANPPPEAWVINVVFPSGNVIALHGEPKMVLFDFVAQLYQIKPIGAHQEYKIKPQIHSNMLSNEDSSLTLEQLNITNNSTIYAGISNLQ